MPTVKLIPSTYYLSNSSYLSISNASNAYTDTDSDTYATVTNSRSNTTSYYVYLRGFNFDDVPSNAIVSSFSVKFKARESGVSTSSSYRPYICNNTSTITGTCSAVSTTATTQTFSGVAATWDTIKGYGSNFGIRFNCRRASSGTTSYMYLYGAEIEVTYTIPTPRTVTTSLSGNGTIDPSGTNTYYDGDEFELVIEPTNTSDTVSATLNGSDITSQLVYHNGGSTTEQNVLGTFDLVSGGFNSGQSWFEGIVGQGYDTDNITTSNYYSSGSGSQCIFTYDVAFMGIPNDATITDLYMMVNGHAESTSNSSEYMCVQLKSGSTELSEQLNFKSVGTSNSTQTVQATTLPTVAQLENLVIECTLGYYGGAINGATVFLTYEVSGVYYTYSTTISGDITIAVTIGGSVAQDVMMLKITDSYKTVITGYKKISGVWTAQTDVADLYDYINTHSVKKG